MECMIIRRHIQKKAGPAPTPAVQKRHRAAHGAAIALAAPQPVVRAEAALRDAQGSNTCTTSKASTIRGLPSMRRRGRMRMPPSNQA